MTELCQITNDLTCAWTEADGPARLYIEKAMMSLARLKATTVGIIRKDETGYKLITDDFEIVNYV